MGIFCKLFNLLCLPLGASNHLRIMKADHQQIDYETVCQKVLVTSGLSIGVRNCTLYGHVAPGLALIHRKEVCSFLSMKQVVCITDLFLGMVRFGHRI